MYSAPVASEIVNMNIDIMCQLCHDAMCKKITVQTTAAVGRRNWNRSTNTNPYPCLSRKFLLISLSV